MYKYVISLLFFVIVVGNVFSQPITLQKLKEADRKKFEFSFEYQMSNASIYYDENGNTVTLPKYKRETINDTIDLYEEYTFQFTQYSFIPTLKWMPLENLDISAKLKIAYSFLAERHKFDSLYIQQPKANYSLFQAEYLALAADYYIFRDNFQWAIIGGISIPFGFHNGQMNDPDYDFLSDGAFEVIAGTKIKFSGEEGYLSAGAIYNWRDEDLEPLMIISGKAAFTNVPGTELAGFINYYKPFKDNADLPPFNIRYHPLNEETIQLGVLFKISFDNDMFAQAGYQVNIGGKNTFGLGLFSIAMGVRF